MAEQPSKHYVSGPGRAPTDDEALQMGYVLFDRIASEQAAQARAADDPDTAADEGDE